MIEFIIADDQRKELGYIPKGVSIDMNVGGLNDYELVVPLSLYDKDIWKVGHYFFAPDTEYGGKLANPQISTKTQTITFTGKIFRGMLESQYCIPYNIPSYGGTGSKTYSKLLYHIHFDNIDIHRAYDKIFDERFGDVFRVKAEDFGQTVDYDLPRFKTCLDSAIAVADEYGLRFDLKAKSSNDGFYVELSAETVMDYSDTEETSQDKGIDFVISKRTEPYTHIIVLGSGEGATEESGVEISNRLTGFYRINRNGTLTLVQTIPEMPDTKVYLYDINSIDDRDEMAKEAREKYRNALKEVDSQTIDYSQDIDIDIGNIVGGRDYVTGMYMAEPITKKIIQQDENKVNITYIVGGDA